MKKKLFAIVGNPINHSLSPVLHNYWLNKYNIEADYSLLDVEEQDLENIEHDTDVLETLGKI